MFYYFFMFLSALFYLVLDSNECYFIDYSLLTLEFDMSVSMTVDFVSAVFMSTVLVVVSVVFMYSFIYMQSSIAYKGFMGLMIGFSGSMLLLASSSGMFWMMLGWDGLGLFSFCLILFNNNWSSAKSGLLTFLFNRLGDMFLLSSLWFFMGKLTLVYTEKISSMVLLLFFIGAASKSAQFPFSLWLPEAMAAPTPVSSLVHSSTLVTAGVYVMIRFSDMVLVNPVQGVLVLMSTVSLVLGAIGAFTEMDFKKIVAYSTMSHISFMVFLISNSQFYPALAHMSMHAFFKSMLFMASGMVIYCASGSQDLRVLFVSDSKSKFFIAFPGLCMVGLPFLSGGMSKEMVISVLPLPFMSGFLLTMIVLAATCSMACLMSAMTHTSNAWNVLLPSEESDSFSSVFFIASCWNALVHLSFYWKMVLISVNESSFMLKSTKALILSLMLLSSVALYSASQKILAPKSLSLMFKSALMTLPLASSCAKTKITGALASVKAQESVSDWVLFKLVSLPSAESKLFFESSVCVIKVLLSLAFFMLAA
uniref:NADH:ubiquinone reductase (H(+)-translocating) n=1 Tax=Pedicinus obtusus TaxID=592408 RepID=A0A7L9CWM6_9NEOP|nr:NADH dehydrogenase subunit 5 [Pedicinus obtusus]